MQYLGNNDVYYEGEIIDMFGFKKRDNNKEISENKGYDDTKEKDKIAELSLKFEELAKKLEKNNSKERVRFIIEFVSFLLLLVATFGGAFAYLHTQFSNMNDKIDVCLTEGDIAELETSVNGIEAWILGDINDLNKIGANQRFNTIENNLNTINKRLDIVPIDISESTAVENLKNTASMENTSNNTNVSLSRETYLGKDSNEKKYNIGDIIGEAVLLTYNEDAKEVYFYGQINENLHWEGHCITNVYNSDETLYGICESDFDNGTRLNYESFYLSSIKDEWIYTKRICDDKGNLGISEKINFNYNKIKNFTKTNVRVYDLLYIKDFSNSDNKTLLTYYSGYTFDGQYNDQYDYNNETDRRPPYEIIFNSDGTIKTLYIGRFSEGTFNDSTGNAWDIAYTDEYGFYVHNTGNFTDGHAIDGSSDPIGINEIENILLENNFSCGFKLNWKQTKYDKEQEN